MASARFAAALEVVQFVEEAVVVDVFEKGHHLRMWADDVGDVEERQPHLRCDVVGDGLRECVGHVLLTQPRQQLLVEPPRRLHRSHEDLMAPRIEQDPLQLRDVRQDEVEQLRSGLRANIALHRGNGGPAVTDQVGDNRRIGLDRRLARHQRPVRRDPRRAATG